MHLSVKHQRQSFLDLGLNWANIYALTESGLPATMTGIKDKYPVLTAGSMKHNPEIEIAIHNKDFEGIGEIYVKSDLIMKEYFREPELTKAAFDKGYFKTGDYGYVDDKGYLYITGRMKESILLHNGKKVSPSDIDEYYGKLCPGIMIASCGVGKDAFDEIHLFIQTAEMEKEKLTEATEKIEEQSKRNSLYQIKQIHFIDKIPVTSVGKVKRYQLVKLAKEIVDENGEKRAEKNSTELSAIYALFNEVLHRGADGKIDREMKLKEDLGMDSLSIFELGSLIEEKYRLNISDKLGELVTVNDLLLLIKNPEKKSGEENSAYDVSRYPVVQDKKIKARLKKYVRWSRTLWNIEVKGVENIPAKGTYILAPNHESRLDALWILSGLSKRIDLNRKICCLSADEHLQKKYYKVMNALGGIPVNRTGNTAPSIKRMEECLRDGYIAIIHPEGTRTRSGKLGEFKDGTAKVAIDTGVPIIPVRISGAYAIFPYDRKFPKVFDYKHFRRYRVTIDIGEIIVPQNMSKEEITKEIREQIIKMER